MDDIIIVERTPWATSHDMAWRWLCQHNLDGDPIPVWHTTVDDQGFAPDEKHARMRGEAHRLAWHGDRDVVLCGTLLPGRLSMRCTAPLGHAPLGRAAIDLHIHTTKDGRFYYGLVYYELVQGD